MRGAARGPCAAGRSVRYTHRGSLAGGLSRRPAPRRGTMTVCKLGIMTARVAAVGAALVCASQAHAFVLWANSSGSAPLFTYTGGGSNLGLFGNPNIVGNTFQFNPPAFTATS